METAAMEMMLPGLGLALAFLGVAIATFLSGIGSVFGVSLTGQAGTGFLVEKPKEFGKMLVLEALPGSQGIYGLVISFIFVMTFDLATIDLYKGLQVFAACLPVAITGYFSAQYQAKVCVSGMNMIAKDEKNLGKVITMAAFVETYAILGFLMSLFMLYAI